jgi:hypothetical protein
LKHSQISEVGGVLAQLEKFDQRADVFPDGLDGALDLRRKPITLEEL